MEYGQTLAATSEGVSPALSAETSSLNPAVVGHRKLSVFNRALLAGVQTLAGLGVGVLATQLSCADVEIGGQEAKICTPINPVDWSGGTESNVLGLLGSLEVPETHDGPIHITINGSPINLTAPEIQKMRQDPASADKVGEAILDDINNDLSAEVRRPLLKTLGLLVGGSAATWAFMSTVDVLRHQPGTRKRDIATSFGVGAVLGTVALVPVGVMMYESYNPHALNTAKVTGPAGELIASGDELEALVQNIGTYSKALSEKAAYVSRVYQAAHQLGPKPSQDTLRALYIANTHCNIGAFKTWHAIAKQAGAEVIFVGGGLTDYGSPLENVCIEPINEFKDARGKTIRAYYVKDNHDGEQSVSYIKSRLKNVTVLDGTTINIKGLPVLGISDPRHSGDPAQNEAVDTPEMLAHRENLIVTAFSGGAKVLLVHESNTAAYVAGNNHGSVGTVLSTFTYKRESSVVNGTNLHLEGTAGANGARILEGEQAAPVMGSILEFNKANGRLVDGEAITIRAFDRPEPWVNISSLDPQILYRPPQVNTLKPASVLSPNPGE